MKICADMLPRQVVPGSDLPKCNVMHSADLVQQLLGEKESCELSGTQAVE